MGSRHVQDQLQFITAGRNYPLLHPHHSHLCSTIGVLSHPPECVGWNKRCAPPIIIILLSPIGAHYCQAGTHNEIKATRGSDNRRKAHKATVTPTLILTCFHQRHFRKSLSLASTKALQLRARTQTHQRKVSTKSSNFGL